MFVAKAILEVWRRQIRQGSLHLKPLSIQGQERSRHSSNPSVIGHRAPKPQQALQTDMEPALIHTPSSQARGKLRAGQRKGAIDDLDPAKIFSISAVVAILRIQASLGEPRAELTDRHGRKLHLTVSILMPARQSDPVGPSRGLRSLLSCCCLVSVLALHVRLHHVNHRADVFIERRSGHQALAQWLLDQEPGCADS